MCGISLYSLNKVNSNYINLSYENQTPKSELNVLSEINDLSMCGNNVKDEVDFSLKRLIVEGDVVDDYGAYEAISGYLQYHIFCYKSVEETEYAYYKFLNDGLNVYPDQIVKAQTYSSGDNYDYSPYYSWGAKSMEIGGIRKYLTDNNVTKEMVVVVMDSGINTSHEIFQDRLLKDESDNIVGFSYINTTYTYSGYSFEDDNWHGTHVAGIIADLTPDNIKILPIKVLNDDGEGSISDILKGYAKIAQEYALIYDIVCVNVSISGFYKYGSAYVDLLENNILPIVAAGNESENISIYKSENADKCILVSALTMDENGRMSIDSSYSNYGKYVDISAPGTSIRSAYIGSNGMTESTNSYATLNGTSMATPHVSAAVALLALKFNNYSTEEITEALYDNTIDLGTVGYDKYYGNGAVFLKYFCDVKSDEYIIFDVVDENIDMLYNSNIYFNDKIDRVTIDLGCTDDSYIIKYTTDGTLPSLNNGIILTDLITISRNDNVKNINVFAYKLDEYGYIDKYTSFFNINFKYSYLISIGTSFVVQAQEYNIGSFAIIVPIVVGAILILSCCITLITIKRDKK